MNPSPTTTQRGARVGTSSASLILTRAAGFGRSAAPPSSSANAPLVCLGAAPAGPLFTPDSRRDSPLLVLLSFGFSRGCDTPKFINVPVYFFGAWVISGFYILNVSPQNLSDVSRFASSGSPCQFFEFFIDLFGQNHTDGNLLSAHAITSELYFTAVLRESVIGNIAYAQGSCSAKTKQRKNSRSGERYRGGIQRGACAPLCVVAGGGS